MQELGWKCCRYCAPVQSSKTKLCKLGIVLHTLVIPALRTKVDPWSSRLANLACLVTFWPLRAHVPKTEVMSAWRITPRLVLGLHICTLMHTCTQTQILESCIKPGTILNIFRLQFIVIINIKQLFARITFNNKMWGIKRRNAGLGI